MENSRAGQKFKRRSYPSNPIACVVLDGPHPKINTEGDLIKTWWVFFGDAEADPVKGCKCYVVHSYEKAHALAFKMADERRIHVEVNGLEIRD